MGPSFLSVLDSQVLLLQTSSSSSPSVCFIMFTWQWCTLWDWMWMQHLQCRTCVRDIVDQINNAHTSSRWTISQKELHILDASNVVSGTQCHRFSHCQEMQWTSSVNMQMLIVGSSTVNGWEREEMWMRMRRNRSPVVGQTKIMNVFSATMESNVSSSQAVIKSVITSSAHTIWLGIELWIDAIHGYTGIQRCCCYCCSFVMSGPYNLLWTLLTLCQLKERGNILMEFTSLHRVDSTIASWVPCHGYNTFLLTLGAICNYELIRSEKTHTRGRFCWAE